MTTSRNTIRCYATDLILGVSIGAVETSAFIALIKYIVHDEMEPPLWAIAAFGAYAGAIATAIIFLIRAIRFAASKIKQALRRQITTRHARKSQGITLPDGD